MLQHPGHQREESQQECRQPRDGAEGGVLQRCCDLNQVDDDSNGESNEEEWSAQPERGPKCLADNVDRCFGGHMLNTLIDKSSSSTSRPPDSIHPPGQTAVS